MILPICVYGNAVLRKKAEAVGIVTAELKQLADDMLDTMYAAKGVGLAAEQVGRTERLCVIDVPADCEKEEYRESNAAAAKMPMVLFNPEIISAEGVQTDSEGCLSFPKLHSPVERANTVTVTFIDMDGMRQTVTASGLLARCIQHELDHLDGVVFLDRAPEAERLKMEKKMKKLAAKK